MDRWREYRSIVEVGAFLGVDVVPHVRRSALTENLLELRVRASDYASVPLLQVYDGSADYPGHIDRAGGVPSDAAAAAFPVRRMTREVSSAAPLRAL